MKRIFGIFALLGALWFSAAGAQAQGYGVSDMRALVVTTCGTVPHPYAPGLYGPPTIDVNGNWCSSGGGGGGSNASVGTITQTAPGSATFIGFSNSGGLLTGVSPTNPLPVSATLSGFHPAAIGTPITATTSGVTGTLPAGSTVVAYNADTTNGVYCQLGATSGANGTYIAPGGGFPFTISSETQISCESTAATVKVNLVGGTGLATGWGGGSGGGSSGGTVNQGTPAASGPWIMQAWQAGAVQGIGNPGFTAIANPGGSAVALVTTNVPTTGDPFLEVGLNPQGLISGGTAGTGAAPAGSVIYDQGAAGGYPLNTTRAAVNAGQSVVQTAMSYTQNLTIGTLLTFPVATDATTDSVQIKWAHIDFGNLANTAVAWNSAVLKLELYNKAPTGTAGQACSTNGSAWDIGSNQANHIGTVTFSMGGDAATSLYQSADWWGDLPANNADTSGTVNVYGCLRLSSAAAVTGVATIPGEIVLSAMK